MNRQKRPILEIVTSATRQVVKKFKTVTGNLSAPPLGLTEVARQWVATNYKVRAYHNGDAEAMYGRFKEALADAIGDGLNITEYQGFANAEQFQRAHWFSTGFSRQGASTRSNYATDLWARDRGNGAGVKEGPVLAALRRELLEHPDARCHHDPCHHSDRGRCTPRWSYRPQSPGTQEPHLRTPAAAMHTSW